MADAINVTFDSAPVLARLEEIARQVDNMRPAYAAIGEALAESTKQRFSNSTGPDGKRWAPNAPATVLAKLGEISGAYTKKGRLSKKGAAAVMSQRPLVDSGILQDTITWQADSTGVEIGTNRFSNDDPEGGGWTGGAAVHQFGSKNGKIPARPFLGLSADDERTVLDILSEHLRQATGAQ